MDLDARVMITASDSPTEFNGIKLFNGNSLGYSKAQEAEIEIGKVYYEKRFRTGHLETLGQSQGVQAVESVLKRVMV